MEKITSFRGKYGFLSNFYETEIEFEGIIYPSVEHAYVASKTLDKNERLLISKMETAGKAKRYGKKIKLREYFDEIKLSIMEELIEKKFSYKHLADLLIKTYPMEIIEENSWNDYFWGVCYNLGSNNLGKILMRVRDKLMQ